MPRHQRAEPLRLGNPGRGAALRKPAIIDKLNVEAADRRGLAEHVGLELAGAIPGRLPAHRGIERKDQPAALAGLGHRRRTERFDLIEKADRSPRVRTRPPEPGPAYALAPAHGRTGPCSSRVAHREQSSGRPSASLKGGIRWPSPAKRAMAGAKVSIGQQIVGLERLSGRGDPFGARGGAALAALVDRQP